MPDIESKATRNEELKSGIETLLRRNTSNPQNS